MDDENKDVPEFKTLIKTLITKNGKILIGKKEKKDHPMSGQWHIPCRNLEKDKELEEAATRVADEKTGLEVEIHQIVDVKKCSRDQDKKNSVEVLYHVESYSEDAEVKEDLTDIKWVKPEDLLDELGDIEASSIQKRDRQEKFLEKMEKAPIF